MWHALDNDGLVLARFTSETDAINNTPSGGSLVYSVDKFDYLEAGTPKAIPTPPSPHYEWDWPTKSWLPNLDAARASKLQQVAAELDSRLHLPCNGFDADPVSRERISGTIALLQRGDGLPAGRLGWRDAGPKCIG